MKNFHLLLIFIFSLALSAQSQPNEKLNLELRYFLSQSQDADKVPLLVKSSSELHELVIQNEGRIRLKLGAYYSVEIPAANVPDFASSEIVEQIEFSTSPGRMLNDSMRANNKIDSLQYISSRFPSTHTGKGVIMGIIDSGIDFTHPDFKDSLGNTRILNIWDQVATASPSSTPQPYGYGHEWDSAAVNAGRCTHKEPSGSYGHGSMVAGAAAGNGLATGNYRGIATESNLIVVATDYSRVNWLQTVAEAVDYIFRKADSLGKACVINISAGTYLGSHDGKDIAAQIIDSLIKEKKGRAVVAAAGNAGHQNFHLGYNVTSDTNFTWFEYNNNFFGSGGIYFKLYSDTADFNDVYFHITANKNGGNYEIRGKSPSFNIQNRLNTVSYDTLKSLQGHKLAILQTYAEENDGVYAMDVGLIEVDSTQYFYGFSTTGNGRFDIWSSLDFGTSNMISSNLPTPSQYPNIIHYKKPDSLQTMVSSFTCLPSVVTVGNYVNRNSYLDASGNLHSMGSSAGDISPRSSLGPTRQGVLKPDISAPGDNMISASDLSLIQQLLIVEPSKISADSMHMRNGGTSMAAPGVAGILALYLEKCPKADYKEMRDALINNAKKDRFTPNSYTPKWGHGKVDAYRTLVSSNFIPTITGPTQNLCIGDTAIIESSAIYQSYSWSNGDSSAYILPTSSGNYSLTATNFSGCRAISDSVSLNFLSTPKKPIISQQNDTLYSSGVGNHHWYYNGNLIAGADSSKINLSLTGVYNSEVVHPLTGCSNISDDYHVQITSMKENSKPDFKIYPNPGSGMFIVESNNDQVRNYKIRDLSGRLIHSMKSTINQKVYKLDLSHISKGIYILSVKKTNEQHVQKLIIQ